MWPMAEMQLAQQLRRLDWVETAGELGAQLLEMSYQGIAAGAESAPALQYRYLLLAVAPAGLTVFQPELIFCARPAFGLQEHLYGIFGSQRDAQNTLRKIAELNQLCLIKTGLEAPNKSAPRPCSAYQIKALPRCLHRPGRCGDAQYPSAQRARQATVAELAVCRADRHSKAIRSVAGPISM